MNTIDFLTRTGQTCTPIRQEFILLSDVLGVSALVDALNNPSVGNATESTVLGPFFTEDAPDGQFEPPKHTLTPSRCPTVPLGESIASEGKGDYMYVEGRVLDSSGKPVPGAVIETWETDDKGEQKQLFFSRWQWRTIICFFFYPIHQASTTLSTRNATCPTAAVGCERTQRATLDTARSSPSRIPSLVMSVFALLDLTHVLTAHVLLSFCPQILTGPRGPAASETWTPQHPPEPLARHGRRPRLP
jgi:Catechol dioxygenase N terminus/Dioxygenase